MDYLSAFLATYLWVNTYLPNKAMHRSRCRGAVFGDGINWGGPVIAGVERIHAATPFLSAARLARISSFACLSLRPQFFA
jgi:hypothetical protein